MVLLTATCTAAEDVQIVVDGTKTRQVYEGFGATTLGLVHAGPIGDALAPQVRLRALEALYKQVHLTMGNLAMALLESPDGWDERRNDNDDPQQIDWRGFDSFSADRSKRRS